MVDLFDFADAVKPPAPVAAPDSGEAVIHWIVVTTTRARTGCGIICSSYDLKTKLATTDAGETISCSLDVYSERVTCEACRSAL